MSVAVNTNVASLVAQKHLATLSHSVKQSFQRVSSGYKLNRAADGAADLALSEKLRSALRGTNTALQNAQDGISILRISEGSLDVITNNLQRIRELTVQAASDSNSANQRAALSAEIQARIDDNNRIVKATKFNGTELLTGNLTSIRIHIGPYGASANNSIELAGALASTTATALGLLGATTSTGWTTVGSINFTSNNAAHKFLNDIDAALRTVLSRRSTIGGLYNRFEKTIDNLETSSLMLVQSESRIRDADLAKEISHLTQKQMFKDAAGSILLQANQIPGYALRLLS